VAALGPHRNPPSPRAAAEERNTSRTEGFSDGIFAAAMTLLVLDLLPPEGPLPASFVAMWPNLLAFVISFASILVLWVSHHGIFAYIRRVDPAIQYSNGLLLLIVVFVPFPTALLAQRLGMPGGGFAAALYVQPLVPLRPMPTGLANSKVIATCSESSR
jgi:uncharacterized membrane protein